MGVRWTVFLMSLSVAAGARTAVAGKFNCGDKPIRLAFHEHGLLYQKEGGGIDNDLVDELEKRTGCRFQKTTMARARIWMDLESGALDMSVSGIETPERSKFAWFVPYMRQKNMAIVKAGLSGRIHSAAEFKADTRLVMGAVSSFKHGPGQDSLLDALRKSGRVEDSPDAPTLFQKMAAGRIDGFFSTAAVYRKYFAEMKMDSMVSIQDWTTYESGTLFGLVLSRKRYDEKERLAWKSVVEALRAEGVLRRIFNRYLPKADAERMEISP